ncbi:histone-lysine N-methyltransferase, H3 lysine-9 specific SUVH1-like [Curcuma longa]|uniref:histone-lysine N-methyltransferase, H3 lysine-9 specific SUVH1-like n=1 Tax=Curcuma longa TaxID=136217 RepID=UPI003D9DCF3A
MERRSNCTPVAENGVLDVKPLRSLAPMFPAPLGFEMVTQSNVPPLVSISPVGFPFAMNVGTAHVATRSGANGSINATPVSASTRMPPSGSFWTAGASILAVDDDEEEEEENPPFEGKNRTLSKRDKKSQAGSSGSDAKRKRLIKSLIKPLPLSLPMPDDPRESVDMILMTFDSLRRRLLQVDEAKDEGGRSQYLKAGSIMASRNVKTNVGKRVGSIPGVEVGDIFYFRFEMNLIGLHSPSMAGIDYLTTSFGDKDEPIAICVVSSGGYENEEDDIDVLIYSGQGGSGKHDQKLERGNLALDRSFHKKNQIRVVRSAKDINCPTGKIYIYDGLYKIESSWTEKNKAGFNMFKYKLLREPGQPDGIAIWKMTQKWKENPSSRGKVILPDISSGAENIPVCLVNDVDDERGPNHFVYITNVKHPHPIDMMKPLQGCMCLSVCLPGDTNCSCANHNGGDLPYNSMGLLVRRKPLIYECCSSCQCTFNCRNRVTRKGIRLHFEVFRTSDRGWGLRSWDPIRAGTFICEYTGEVIDRSKIDDEIEEDEYIFQATYLGEKAMGFNCRPELLEESELSTETEVFRSFPITLSAKNSGNIARFINHSCSPNVFWQPVLYDHGDEGYPHIMFFAMKHIPPMAELTYDYGPGSGSIRNKKCLCGAPNCRGYFG